MFKLWSSVSPLDPADMKRVVLPAEHAAQQPGTDSTAAPSPSPSQPGKDDDASAGPRQILPMELMDIIVPSLKVGAGVGKPTLLQLFLCRQFSAIFS